jgi:hypothetical protein
MSLNPSKYFLLGSGISSSDSTVYPHNSTASMSPRHSARIRIDRCMCQQEPTVRAADGFHLSLYGIGDEDGDIA